MAKGVMPGRIGGDDPPVHLLLHEGLIRGELGEATIGPPVCPAVSHMSDQKCPIGRIDMEDGQGAPHALVLGVPPRLCLDSVMCLLHRVVHVRDAGLPTLPG